jgi:hypothetical protein
VSEKAITPELTAKTLAKLERLEQAATEGEWVTGVVAAAHSLEGNWNSWAHLVVKGGHEYTFAHRQCKAYEQVTKRPQTEAEAKKTKGCGDCDKNGDGGRCVVWEGRGRIEPDLSPHPDAALACALRNAAKPLIEAARERDALRGLLRRAYLHLDRDNYDILAKEIAAAINGTIT